MVKLTKNEAFTGLAEELSKLKLKKGEAVAAFEPKDETVKFDEAGAEMKVNDLIRPVMFMSSPEEGYSKDTFQKANSPYDEVIDMFNIYTKFATMSTGIVDEFLSLQVARVSSILETNMYTVLNSGLVSFVGNFIVKPIDYQQIFIGCRADSVKTMLMTGFQKIMYYLINRDHDLYFAEITKLKYQYMEIVANAYSNLVNTLLIGGAMDITSFLNTYNPISIPENFKKENPFDEAPNLYLGYISNILGSISKIDIAIDGDIIEANIGHVVMTMLNRFSNEMIDTEGKK